MNLSSLATLICASGIAGLFYLNRNRSVRIAKSVWLPVVYLWLIGSRPLSSWLGVGAVQGTTELEGSPTDRLVFQILLVAAVGVLIGRGRRPFALLAANWLIVVYFVFCLISVSWAYFPYIAFKRWIKATTDIAMVLVILTDGNPVEAIRRVISRVGFILFPTSVLLIKYYDYLGRVYTVDGALTNVGVTINKNSLGLIVFVISLGALWNVLSLWIHKNEPGRGRRLVAQGTLLAFGIALLGMADSATSLACFILGSGLILLTNVRSIGSRPARVHALCFIILLVGGVTFVLGGDAYVLQALGREPNLTGRTEIWAAVTPAVPNALVGAGFESFWISPNVQIFRSTLARSGWWRPDILNEAHSGYVEMYLNLGWIGVCLISLVLVSGYRRAAKAFQRCRELGSLMLAYIATTAIYCLTEAGFRELNPCWIFFLLAIFGATGVVRGFIDGENTNLPASPGRAANRTNGINELVPQNEAVLGGPARLEPWFER